MTEQDLRPVWLLDVDGVINVPWEYPDTSVWPEEDWIKLSHLHQFPFLTARPVLDFIERVHESGLAEVRWHTTWQHDAHRIEAQFGLPRFEVQDSPEFRERLSIRPMRGEWFKLPAAERVVREEGRSLVWTDDDLAWQRKDGKARVRRLRNYHPTLIIAPDDKQGLTPAHLERIEKFLRVREQHPLTPAS